MSITFVMLLVLIGGPFKQNTGDIKIFDAFGTMRSFGSILFSLSCSQANFQAYESTVKESQNPRSWAKITGVAVGLGTIMCVVTGMTGYLVFLDDTQGEILDNFPESPYDFFKVMVTIHLILYIPVCFTVTRYSVVKILYNRANAQVSKSVCSLSVALHYMFFMERPRIYLLLLSFF